MGVRSDSMVAEETLSGWLSARKWESVTDGRGLGLSTCPKLFPVDIPMDF